MIDKINTAPPNDIYDMASRVIDLAENNKYIKSATARIKESPDGNGVEFDIKKMAKNLIL